MTGPPAAWQEGAVPVFRLTQKLWFPDPAQAEPEGLLAVGGDLSLERLLLAYTSGIFPWYSEGEPLLWWSPPTRAVVVPAEAHIGRSIRKVLKRGELSVRCDTRFADVMRACADTPRPGQRGTWITDAMLGAYVALHDAGLAHSFETFRGDELVGGLYGVSVGGAFFGESMFSWADDASKVAFATLAQKTAEWGFDMIDCQLANDNVNRYQPRMLPRKLYLELLALTIKKPTRRGQWLI